MLIKACTVLIIASLITACAAEKQNSILGKWDLIRQNISCNDYELQSYHGGDIEESIMHKTTYEFKADSTYGLTIKGNEISPFDENQSGNFIIKDSFLILSAYTKSDTLIISEISDTGLTLIVKDVGTKEGDPAAKCHMFNYYKKISL